MTPKTNSHFETILNSIADGVFTVDLEYNITYFNRSAEAITGVSRDQALGQKCFDVFRANICQTACALGKTMQSGQQGINIPVDQALDHVFGYALSLDMTRRDLQGEAKKAGRPWEMGKAFEASAPAGPLTLLDTPPAAGRIARAGRAAGPDGLGLSVLLLPGRAALDRRPPRGQALDRL